MQLTDREGFRILTTLVVVSVLLHATYYYAAIFLMELPSRRFPYWWSILGSVLMNALPILLWREGARRFALFFVTFTLLTGLGMCMLSLKSE